MILSLYPPAKQNVNFIYWDYKLMKVIYGRGVEGPVEMLCASDVEIIV